MSDKKTTKNGQNEQSLVVKNKKYKKGDILAFALCLLAAVVIWICASNAEADQARTHSDVSETVSDITEQK